MSFNICRQLKRMVDFPVRGEMIISHLLIPAILYIYLIKYHEFQNYFFNSSRIVWITVLDEDNCNLKLQLLEEVRKELKRNKLEDSVKSDTTSSEVYICPKNGISKESAEYCLYLGKQAIKNIAYKNSKTHCIQAIIHTTY